MRNASPRLTAFNGFPPFRRTPSFFPPSLPPSLASAFPTLEVGKLVPCPEDGHVGEGGGQDVVVGLEGGRGGGEEKRGGRSDEGVVREEEALVGWKEGGNPLDDGGGEGEEDGGRERKKRGKKGEFLRNRGGIMSVIAHEEHQGRVPGRVHKQMEANPQVYRPLPPSLPPLPPSLPTLKNEVGLWRSVSMKSIRKMCLGASKGRSEASTAFPISVSLPISTVMRHLRGISTTI